MGQTRRSRSAGIPTVPHVRGAPQGQPDNVETVASRTPPSARPWQLPTPGVRLPLAGRDARRDAAPPSAPQLPHPASAFRSTRGPFLLAQKRPGGFTKRPEKTRSEAASASLPISARSGVAGVRHHDLRHSRRQPTPRCPSASQHCRRSSGPRRQSLNAHGHRRRDCSQFLASLLDKPWGARRIGRPNDRL